MVGRTNSGKQFGHVLQEDKVSRMSRSGSETSVKALKPVNMNRNSSFNRKAQSKSPSPRRNSSIGDNKKKGAFVTKINARQSVISQIDQGVQAMVYDKANVALDRIQDLKEQYEKDPNNPEIRQAYFSSLKEHFAPTTPSDLTTNRDPGSASYMQRKYEFNHSMHK